MWWVNRADLSCVQWAELTDLLKIVDALGGIDAFEQKSNRFKYPLSLSDNLRQGMQ
jgi:hypothetical protein